MRKWVTIGDYEGDILVDERGIGESKSGDRRKALTLEVNAKDKAKCQPLMQEAPKITECEELVNSVVKSKPQKAEGQICPPEEEKIHNGDTEISPRIDNKLDKINNIAKGETEGGNSVNQETIKGVNNNFLKKSSRKWQIAITEKLEKSQKVNSDKTEEKGEEETMDAELPTPEHITSFYDLVKAVKNSNENLSPQEIENKFKQLSLAFKTDRLTLRQRLDVQQRQRDIAEANFDRELKQLRSSVLALHEDCIDMELADAITQVRKHIDVLTTSSSSLLSASEVWGAVQQEWRVSRALEVLFLHEENVTRLYENDHQELEGMRRLLAEHQIELPGLPGSASENQSSSTDSTNRRTRAYSLATLSKQQFQETGSRRISLGPGASKTVLNSFLGTRSARRRISLVEDLRPLHQEWAAVTAAAVSANADSKKEEEEKPQPGNGMLSSSITEEGSESGDDGTNDGHQDSNNSIVPSAANLRRLTVLYGQAIQNSDQRSHEDSNASQGHSQGESHLSSNPAASVVHQPQNWVLHNIKELIDLLREGEWPYTSQQIIRGAFTSFLLMLAVFYLILATSSASDELPEPCRPDWTISIRRRGLPPI